MRKRPLATLLALKVLTFAPGLTTNARTVGAVLLDRYNRKTGQCDPGIEGIARHVGVVERTVMRSIDRLVSTGLFRKMRHGGNGNRNQYEPNWQRFHELEAHWRLRLGNSGRDPASPKVSPSSGQDCHLSDDSGVTQTYTSNLPKKTYSADHPNEGTGRVVHQAPRVPISSNNAADAALAEAERRWTKAMHHAFASMPMTYGEIIGAITDTMQAAATQAEMRQRGAGLRYILQALKIPVSMRSSNQ
jgi:hypothetical protein